MHTMPSLLHAFFENSVYKKYIFIAACIDNSENRSKWNPSNLFCEAIITLIPKPDKNIMRKENKTNISTKY